MCNLYVIVIAWSLYHKDGIGDAQSRAGLRMTTTFLVQATRGKFHMPLLPEGYKSRRRWPVYVCQHRRGEDAHGTQLEILVTYWLLDLDSAHTQREKDTPSVKNVFILWDGVSIRFRFNKVAY